uniref:Uncharacterized protein n=1 Tax=Odontella aurita TaxID=265563 RepID=A0A7S4N9W2_9STRA|mmetsp:Transcript_53940/g.161441  ORF Transcript_53940/g.161441 Transcript_53940/m.161441 type:complete len:163 (+) Transcript_53940:143-631(+)
MHPSTPSLFFRAAHSRFTTRRLSELRCPPALRTEGRDQRNPARRSSTRLPRSSRSVRWGALRSAVAIPPGTPRNSDGRWARLSFRYARSGRGPTHRAPVDALSVEVAVAGAERAGGGAAAVGGKVVEDENFATGGGGRVGRKRDGAPVGAGVEGVRVGPELG